MCLVIILIFLSESITPAIAQITTKSKTTVFKAGKNGIDSYRIPSLVLSKNGTLMAFAEARKESSTDKTPTDIVLKRSTDNGITWSEMQFLTDGGKAAFMDPVALVDHITGKIFLFMNLWPAEDHSMKANTAWLTSSIDDGKTWSEPKEITDEITAPGHFMNGFGPGSGIQMVGPKFKNRLILPTRQYDGDKLLNRTVYSDDHGETWKIGTPASTGGEYEIAEAAPDTLIYNLRAGKGQRKKAWSYDGGFSWTKAVMDHGLETTSDYGGCHSSILGVGKSLFFTGPAGGNPDELHEDRQNLKIYHSSDTGKNWQKGILLYDKAAGYSDLVALPTGEIAVLFETANSEGFPKMLPGHRLPGWMRIDLLVLSKKTFQLQ